MPSARRAAKAGVVRSSTADDASMDRVTPSTFGDRTVGGVRLDRISRLVVAWGAGFGGYELGNDYLNVAIVEVLGIDRSQGVGAFGPFVTLLALIYSTILGSIYSQLSSRQGAIQDSLFAEAFAVRDVAEVCDIVDGAARRPTWARRGGPSGRTRRRCATRWTARPPTARTRRRSRGCWGPWT